VELSICSSENLDKGLNNESLWPLIMLLRAQLRVVQRNWSEAIKLFESVLPKAILRGEHGWQMRLRADFAYCYANTMEYDIALKHIERLEGHIEVTVAIDDLAATYARLAFSSKLIGDSNRYEKNMALANKYLDEFQKSQVAILPLLNVAFPELN
jgi:tetratricopeptide (TPR) repeat protein